MTPSLMSGCSTVRCFDWPLLTPLCTLVGCLLGDEDGYQDVTLSLMNDRSLNGSGSQEWWDIAIADCSGHCGVLPMVIFNDKVSPPSLGFLAGYG